MKITGTKVYDILLAMKSGEDECIKLMQKFKDGFNPNLTTKYRMYIGKIYEKDIRDWLSSYLKEDVRTSNWISGKDTAFGGYVDGLTNTHVVEIKISLGNSPETIYENVFPNHYHQMQLYMYITGLKKTYYVYHYIGSQETHIREIVFDENEWKQTMKVCRAFYDKYMNV